MGTFFRNLFGKATAATAGMSARTWGLVAVVAFSFLAGSYSCHKWHNWHPLSDVSDARIGSFGWVPDPDRVDRIVAGWAKPTFADTGLTAADKDALLHLAAVKVIGNVLPAHDQNGTGCCVGEGNSSAIECLQCVDIAIRNAAEDFKAISAAAVYALARESGGMLGKGDGSSGGDAAEAVTKLGTVSCADAKDDNTTGTPHARLAKQWGGRGGLPADLKALARNHLVKSVTRLKSAEDARVALSNGYPIAACSNVGFEGGGGFRRDSEGFCKRGGSWAHCMAIHSYRADKRAFLVIQSWGANTPPGPRTLDQPTNSFWITWADMEAIVRQNDSYAFSQYDGWPGQPKVVDFFVRARPAADPVLARCRSAFAPLAIGLAP